MPYVLLGGGGGALNTGQHLTLDETTNDLYVTLHQAMGANVSTFGDPAHSSGPIGALLA